MNEKVKDLEKKLKKYEKELDLAYINYAKIVDNVVSTEIKKINDYVDKIIKVKKELIEERGQNTND